MCKVWTVQRLQFSLNSFAIVTHIFNLSPILLNVRCMTCESHARYRLLNAHCCMHGIQIQWINWTRYWNVCGIFHHEVAHSNLPAFACDSIEVNKQSKSTHPVFKAMCREPDKNNDNNNHSRASDELNTLWYLTPFQTFWWTSHLQVQLQFIYTHKSKAIATTFTHTYTHTQIEKKKENSATPPVDYH